MKKLNSLFAAIALFAMAGVAHSAGAPVNIASELSALPPLACTNRQELVLPCSLVPRLYVKPNDPVQPPAQEKPE